MVNDGHELAKLINEFGIYELIDNIEATQKQLEELLIEEPDLRRNIFKKGQAVDHRETELAKEAISGARNDKERELNLRLALKDDPIYNDLLTEQIDAKKDADLLRTEIELRQSRLSALKHISDLLSNLLRAIAN